MEAGFNVCPIGCSRDVIPLFLHDLDDLIEVVFILFRLVIPRLSYRDELTYVFGSVRQAPEGDRYFSTDASEGFQDGVTRDKKILNSILNFR
jgi:hypothetical protein